MPNAFTQQLPNAVTCCNLLCGCAATGAAFYGHLQWAVIMIICGAVFDFFDGLTARALGVSSPIGKELDSLADCVTFGVAPSAILFWVMHEVHCPEVLMPLKRILPYSAFLLAAFSALRLAKFNLDTRQSTQFIGLPTPANALFWGSLVLGQHAFLTSLRFNIVWLIALTLLFCYLLVCEVPMMALKFKELTWQALRWKVVFLVGCLCFIPLGYSAFAAIIVWYIFLSVVLVKLHRF